MSVQADIDGQLDLFKTADLFRAVMRRHSGCVIVYENTPEARVQCDQYQTAVNWDGQSISHAIGLLSYGCEFLEMQRSGAIRRILGDGLLPILPPEAAEGEGEGEGVDADDML